MNSSTLSIEEAKTARSFLQNFDEGQCGHCGRTAPVARLVNTTKAELAGHRHAAWKDMCEFCVGETHEVRKYLEGCEGSGKIVFTGTYSECRNARRRFERKSADCYTFSIYRIDGTPTGSQYTFDQDGRKVHQPGF